MLAERIEEIGADLLRALVAERRSETGSLEFKAELPGNSDQDIKEFLKDVAAMANGQGGDIVYGIGELEGVAEKVQPIKGVIADEVIRRLAQRLDDCIEPRLQGRRLHSVVVDDGFLLVLRVPQSQIGPHRTSFKNQHRFPVRNEVNIVDMSYEQLRAAFDRTATLSERARQFRMDRIQAVMADEGRRLEGNGSVVVHVVPLQGMSGTQSIDVLAAYNNYGELALDWGSISRAFNLDGVLVYQAGDLLRMNYTQLYRSGVIEFYSSGFNDQDHRGKQIIASSSLASFCRDAIIRAQAVLRSHGLTGGAYVGVAIIGVNGRALYMGSRFSLYNKSVADRDNLILPEFWVEDLGQADIDEIAQPVLDMVWQSFGLHACAYYDNDGKFEGDRQFE